MEPLEPPYDKYNMNPWDSSDTERLEPEDAEVVRKAYPPSNVRNIFTKICWSPKDKWQLLARCCRIIREKNGEWLDEAHKIRLIIAFDVYTGFLIASGEKEREDPAWEQAERDMLFEAYSTSLADAYLNKKHFALGDKDNILEFASDKIYYAKLDEIYWKDIHGSSRADDDKFYRDAYREFMDPDWYQGCDNREKYDD